MHLLNINALLYCRNMFYILDFFPAKLDNISPWRADSIEWILFYLLSNNFCLGKVIYRESQGKWESKNHG